MSYLKTINSRLLFNIDSFIDAVQYLKTSILRLCQVFQSAQAPILTPVTSGDHPIIANKYSVI